MIYYIITILVFICFIVYDVNSIKFNNHFLNKIFFIGIFIFFMENVILMFTLRNNVIYNRINIVLITFSIIFFCLLIYTLFFSLPFNDTYIKKENEGKVIKTGMYGFSRHIGVLWFILMYVPLIFVFKSNFFNKFVLLSSILNVIYVVFQDNYTFLYSFENYEEYKKEVPFIMPTLASIKKTCEKRKKNEFQKKI